MENNIQMSSCEFSSTAKGELTFKIKVYNQDINTARDLAQEQVFLANDWIKENWINYPAAIEILTKKIEALEGGAKQIKGATNGK